MLVGKVKWFDCRKGYGFVVDDQQQDVFVHYTAIEGDTAFRKLRDGETVTYEPAVGKNGLYAKRVTRGVPAIS